MRNARSTVRIILYNIDALIAGVALLGALFLVLINVVMRYFWPELLPWTEEIILILNTWAIFLGSAYVYRRGANLNSNMLINRFSRNNRFLIKLTVDFLVMLSLAALTYAGILYIKNTYEQITVVSERFLYYRNAAIPFGFGLSFLYAVFFFLKDLLTAETEKGENE